ncbi:heme-dependent oxidative N-demethylase family protein [Pseudodonghicola flavimaris]|uniref:DUF3445 domain-containing protein n=1 Tax=Pseudodonghicola flavimaris TaxID=3050036 RepID=A0ABT7F7A0_9RHOB|nr:DUF3445 domain-containing protein [Pseudodonghicola flavimaris]MDK3020483.1 DUF3445 domain-containing protein [Pseudodonghicola flavimaris]
MTVILQKSLPYDVSQHRRLPGIQPLKMEDWLLRDEAFAGQMAYRDRLLAEKRDKVLALDAAARPAALELLDMVLAAAYPDAGAGDRVTRPDGIEVRLDRDDPLATLGRLVQEDFCILEKPEGAGEHVLTGAVLCFPASWTLAEKFMHPLLRIHRTVAPYDDNVGARVQRLFDGVQVGRPLWRFNQIWYMDADLHAPRLEADKRWLKGPEPYFRSERQTMVRLPETRAVAFGIHTYVLEAADVPDAVERPGGAAVAAI